MRKKQTKEERKAVQKKWRINNKEKLKKDFLRWKENNKEKYLDIQHKAAKKWRENNKDKIAASRRRTRDKLRNDVLTAYGGKCACCGETIPEFLSIDHIDGKGAEHRREIGAKSAQAMYTWLRKNGYPKDNFQLLCHNCNSAKYYYGGCPHQRNKNANK